MFIGVWYSVLSSHWFIIITTNQTRSKKTLSYFAILFTFGHFPCEKIHTASQLSLQTTQLFQSKDINVSPHTSRETRLTAICLFLIGFFFQPHQKRKIMQIVKACVWINYHSLQIFTVCYANIPQIEGGHVCRKKKSHYAKSQSLKFSFTNVT